MGGFGQPYLYDPPKKDPVAGFNPKAVTEASRRPPPPKRKQDGPLINFNQHPDSHLVMPYGKTDAKPMSPKTAGRVKWARWIQLFFRVLQLAGAIGLLICVIFIRGTQDTEGWIIRLPPGFDIIVSLYGVYHLCRAARHRTPASSASYHFFALVTDAGFIPFYVFIAILDHNQYTEAYGADGRWRTFFEAEDATNKVLQVTWLGAVSIGGMHCASMLLDLYLVIIFRKIANMPPDMNPLEENLTSRRAAKHKHKNSEATLTTMSEKRGSALSGSTLNLDGPGRGSQVNDPLIPDARTIPFIHTRKDSDSSYNPHNPRSARQSRIDLSEQMYKLPSAQRASRVDTLNSGDDMPLSKRASHLAAQLKRDSGVFNGPSRQHPPSTASSNWSSYQPVNLGEPMDITEGQRHIFSDGSSAYSQRPSTADTLQRQTQIISDNWFVHQSGNSVKDEPYKPVRRFSLSSDSSSEDEAEEEQGEADPFHRDFRQPLCMNPPTPPHARPSPSPSPSTSPHRHHISQPSISSLGSLSQAGTPKSRYYGDLKTATANLRPVSRHSPSPAMPTTEQQPGSPSKSVFNKGPERHGYDAFVSRSPRVVSRTGVDEGDLGIVPEMATGVRAGAGGWRRRDVSGKVAEEGRSAMVGRVR